MKALRFILPLAMVFGFTLPNTAQTSKMGLVDQQAIVLKCQNIVPNKQIFRKGQQNERNRDPISGIKPDAEYEEL